MQIKYVGSGPSYEVKMLARNFCQIFIKNVWTTTPDEFVPGLVKSGRFIAREADPVRLSKLHSIAFKRWGAIGDIIMLFPVLRQFRKAYPWLKIYLIVDGYIADILQNQDVFDGICDPNSTRFEFDQIISLDSCLERDHSTTNYEREMHRVHLYEDILGVKCDQYDFSLKIPIEDIKYIEGLLCS